MEKVIGEQYETVEKPKQQAKSVTNNLKYDVFLNLGLYQRFGRIKKAARPHVYQTCGRRKKIAPLTNQKLKDAFDSQEAATIVISAKMSGITTNLSYKNANLLTFVAITRMKKCQKPAN